MIRAVTQSHVLERRLALSLITLCVSLFAAYIYFLSASVMHVVVRTEVDQTARELRSKISVLEGEFIAAQHAVSQNIAHLEGYERVNAKIFVDRAAPSLVLNTESQP